MEQAILLIDTSTSSCSIALAVDTNVLAEKYIASGQAHAATVAGFVKEVLAASQIKTVKAVAVSEGPGSYTGLRIGASLAKGLAFGWDVPLIAIPTLDILAQDAALQSEFQGGQIRPMIDARRMEVYTALYDSDVLPHSETQSLIIDEHSFADELSNGAVYFVGDANAKVKTIIKHPNAVFLDTVCSPRALPMARLASRRLELGETADLAYWQPFYLKPYEAIIAKNKVLERAKEQQKGSGS